MPSLSDPCLSDTSSLLYSNIPLCFIVRAKVQVIHFKDIDLYARMFSIFYHQIYLFPLCPKRPPTNTERRVRPVVVLFISLTQKPSLGAL